MKLLIIAFKSHKLFVLAYALTTGFAVTEAFMGQLVIALIAAIPPTGMMVIALVALLRGQERMHKSLDGKLTELVEAKTEVAREQGAKQERVEERERVAVAAEKAPPVVTTAQIVAATVAAVKEADPGKIDKMIIVSDDQNPVITKPARSTDETK